MIYWQLFWTFFKIGLFNFGGGYAMISFIEQEVVAKHAWLTTAQFTDIVAISQATPGPVGINMATFAGYTASGTVTGALVASAAVCLPSFILLIGLSRYFLKHRHTRPVEGVFGGLRPAVVGLIAAAALVLCNAQNFVGISSVCLFAGAFLLVFFNKVGPVGVLLLSGVIGVLIY